MLKRGEELVTGLYEKETEKRNASAQASEEADDSVTPARRKGKGRATDKGKVRICVRQRWSFIKFPL